MEQLWQQAIQLESFTTQWGLELVEQLLVEVIRAALMYQLGLLVGWLVLARQGSSWVELQAVE
jgi:hypothetical protein